MLIVTYVRRNDGSLNATTSPYVTMGTYFTDIYTFTLYVTAHMHTLLDSKLCYKVDTYNGFALSFGPICKEFKVN